MTFPPIQTPFRLHQEVVRSEWIDHNGHMNAWFYHDAFRPPIRHFFNLLELGKDFQENSGLGIFMLEFRVQYIGEVMQGMPLTFDVRLIDHSEKILHYLVEMRAGEDEYLAATAEVLEMQMNLQARRPEPFSDELQTYLQAMKTAHAVLPQSPGVGKAIGIRRSR